MNPYYLKYDSGITFSLMYFIIPAGWHNIALGFNPTKKLNRRHKLSIVNNDAFTHESFITRLSLRSKFKIYENPHFWGSIIL